MGGSINDQRVLTAPPCHARTLKGPATDTKPACTGLITKLLVYSFGGDPWERTAFEGDASTVWIFFNL